MFGLEKKGNALFEFDLEKDLKGNPAKIKEMLQTVEKQIQEIKNTLRQGTESKDFDQLGILLHGYAALQKVLTRIANKK
jgi:HPt (histidine-containing phosphotransfer) domain-containing protein